MSDAVPGSQTMSGIAIIGIAADATDCRDRSRIHRLLRDAVNLGAATGCAPLSFRTIAVPDLE
jgi:hypothetical protein